MLRSLVKTAARILPPTIHPMVVHFPIALAYLTLLAEVAMWLAEGDTRRFLGRAAFWLLTLECLAIIAAMLAGIVSEQSVHFTPVTSAILSEHQHFAILTGLSAGVAWLGRVFSRFPRSERSGWSILGTGRGRPNALTTLFVALSVLFITITGSLGGTMVYQHGVGVHVTPAPATTSAHARG